MPITIGETRQRVVRRDHRSQSQPYTHPLTNRSLLQVVNWLENGLGQRLSGIGISQDDLDEYRLAQASVYGPNQYHRLVRDVLEYAARRHFLAMSAVVLDGALRTTHAVARKTIYLSGPNIYQHHAALIAQARYEIMIQTFQWYCDTHTQPCEAAAAIVQALRNLDANLDRALNVYLLVDGALYQSTSSPYHRAIQTFEAEDFRYIAVSIRGYEHAGRNVLHSKSLIVDGSKALLTGANVQPFYNANRTWYDASFEFCGDGARLLRAEFCDAWTRSTTWLKSAKSRLFWFKQLGEANSGLRTYARTRQHPLSLVRSGMPRLPHPTTADYVANLSCIRLDGEAGSLAFRGTPRGSQVAGYRSAIEEARYRIRVHTPNLNHDVIVGLLVDAVNRGIRVEMVLSKGFNDGTEHYSGGSNAETVDHFRRQWPGGMPRNLDIRWYTSLAGVMIDDNNDQLRRFSSHAKYMSIDSALVIVGSTNLDNQSFKMSRETNLALFSGEITRVWDAAFFEPSFNRATSVAEDLRFHVGQRLKCSLCLRLHGTLISSSFLGRWHVCQTCNAVFCDKCGLGLNLVGLFSRERRCGMVGCNGRTRLEY